MTNTSTVRKINDWAPEVRSLLKALVSAGCTLVSGDNGEEEFLFKAAGLEAFIENLIACDESRLYVKTPASGEEVLWLYLVLGNSPGELVCDYIFDGVIDTVVNAEADKWESRKQPTKLVSRA